MLNRYRLISEEKLKELLDIQIKYDALDCWGVDNWEGYSEAFDNMADLLNEEHEFFNHDRYCASEVFDCVIDEEFEILGEWFNPYKITEKGYLIDRDGDEQTDPLVWLILGQREIRKIPKPEIKKIPKPEIKEMTVPELEEALGLPKGTLRVKGDE